MFAGGMDPFVGVFFVHGGAVAGEFADVGEGVEQDQFCFDDGGVVAGDCGAQLFVSGEQCSGAGGADIESGDQCGQFFQPCQRSAAGRFVAWARYGAELHAFGLGGGFLLPGLIDPQQGGTGIDLTVHRGEDFTDPARVGRADRGFHFHRLEHHQCLAGFDVVTDSDGDRDDDGGGGGTHQPGLVLADLMGDAVDLDEEMRGTGDGDHLVAAIAEDESAFVLPEPFDVDLQLTAATDTAAAVAVEDVAVDAVAVWSELSDAEGVALSLVVQFDGAADGVCGAGAATAGGGEERGPLVGFGAVVGIDGGGEDRDVGDGRRSGGGAGVGAVEPPGISGSGDHLVLVEQAEEERFGGGAAVDDHRRLTQCGAQPGECFVAVAAPGDDLGDHGIVVGGNDIALGDAGVDAQTGAEGELEQLHRARCRGEPVVGVLGVQTRFHSMPELRWAIAVETLPVGDLDL